MKNILKFFTIFSSSLLLAVIFGYWFGALDTIIMRELFQSQQGFSTFFIASQTASLIEGVLLGYPLFLSFLVTVFEDQWRLRLGSLVIGLFILIPIFYFAGRAQNLVTIVSLTLGFLLGEAVLFIKRKLQASHLFNKEYYD